MTDKQPEALRLADAIDYPDVSFGNEAAAELRRLHEVNAELMEALTGADETIDWLVLHLKQHHDCLHMDSRFSGIPKWIAKSRAAIAKATGEQR